MELLIAIAVLCQATPSGFLVSGREVREGNAMCQQRVLNCVLNQTDVIDLSLLRCVKDGAVFPLERKKEKDCE